MEDKNVVLWLQRALLALSDYVLFRWHLRLPKRESLLECCHLELTCSCPLLFCHTWLEDDDARLARLQGLLLAKLGRVERGIASEVLDDVLHLQQGIRVCSVVYELEDKVNLVLAPLASREVGEDWLAKGVWLLLETVVG